MSHAVRWLLLRTAPTSVRVLGWLRAHWPHRHHWARRTYWSAARGFLDLGEYCVICGRTRRSRPVRSLLV